MFIVIGANNSSNSLRLVEVADQYGAKKSMLLENINNFDISILENIKSIGITASASAPEVLLQDLVRYIKKNYIVILHQPESLKENVNFNIPHQLKVTN